jgi:flagellar basal body-associated protein FliL
MQQKTLITIIIVVVLLFIVSFGIIYYTRKNKDEQFIIITCDNCKDGQHKNCCSDDCSCACGYSSVKQCDKNDVCNDY